MPACRHTRLLIDAASAVRWLFSRSRSSRRAPAVQPLVHTGRVDGCACSADVRAATRAAADDAAYTRVQLGQP
jgi:hypothetical protein